MIGYNCFIIFQYYYLNIKILKCYENLEIFEICWNFGKYIDKSCIARMFLQINLYIAWVLL